MDHADQIAERFTPFKLGWWGTDLGKYRACDGTYCYFPYESLPPLPDLDGTLGWLDPLHDDIDRQMEIYRNAPEARGKLAEIAAAAERLGLTLPATFTRLMVSPELQDHIPSCTACYFELSERIVPCPGSERGYIIRFLNDQQDVLLWYLYLTLTGEHRVLVSPFRLDDPDESNGSDDSQEQAGSEDNTQTIVANTLVCAPSFEAFIYRFWLENVLWFKLNDGGPLTPEEQRYVAHYARAQDHH